MFTTSLIYRAKKYSTNVLLLIMLTALSACGGGGGGDSSSNSNGGNGGGTTTNSAPSISLSTTGTVDSGQAFSVTASASDSDGSIASYAWAQTSGTSVSLSNSTSASLSFTAPSVSVDTVLGFRLTVTDNDGASVTANIQVTVTASNTGGNGGTGGGGTTNSAPTITLAPLGTVNSGGTFSITASASDSDGSIASYSWSQASGTLVSINNTTSSSISFNAPSVSTDTMLTFTLTVTDNDGATASANIQITVLAITGITALKGKVLDYRSGNPVEGAIVSSGTKSTLTDVNGYYEITSLPYNDRTVVNVSHESYAIQSKNVRISVAENDVKLTFKVTPVSIDDTFSQGIEKSLTDDNSQAYILITENTLVDSSGTVYDDSITGQLTFLDPAQFSDVMAGDYLTSNNGNPIESFGGIYTRFYERGNLSNEFSLKSGSTAVIRIPVSSKNDIVGTDGSTAPSTLNLYYYNESTGYWEQDGVANFVLQGSKSYYEGTISRLGAWSTNASYSNVDVQGCVVDLNNNPLSNITVVSDGDNYSGSFSTTTDTNGNFTLKAKANSDILVWASNSGVRSNTVVGSTGSSSASINDCLVVADLAITVTVSWGLGLDDVDAHFYTPFDHVYWGNKGSLIASPYAQLDVDDEFELGPEVITIVGLPDVGTYSFKVHNYSRFQNGVEEMGLGTANTKVEFNFKGDVTLYVPPSGETSKTAWHVFDLEVSSPGLFTVVDVNTWSKDL